MVVVVGLLAALLAAAVPAEPAEAQSKADLSWKGYITGQASVSSNCSDDNQLGGITCADAGNPPRIHRYLPTTNNPGTVEARTVPVVFRISRALPPGTTINYSLGGTATYPGDYGLPGGHNVGDPDAEGVRQVSFTLNGGAQHFVRFNLNIKRDGVCEREQETLDLTLEDGSGYDLSGRRTVTLTIEDSNHIKERPYGQDKAFNEPIRACEPNRVPEDWALTPAGLGVGDEFRLLFLTSVKRDATAAGIDAYNQFIWDTIRASGHDAIKKYSSSFMALACTAEVDARDNTSTNGTTDQFNRGGHDRDTDTPVYYLGGPIIADNLAMLYRSSNGPNGPHLNPANGPGFRYSWTNAQSVTDESGTEFGYTGNGGRLEFLDQERNYATNGIWVGCNRDGTKHAADHLGQVETIIDTSRVVASDCRKKDIVYYVTNDNGTSDNKYDDYLEKMTRKATVQDCGDPVTVYTPASIGLIAPHYQPSRTILRTGWSQAKIPINRELRVLAVSSIFKVTPATSDSEQESEPPSEVVLQEQSEAQHQAAYEPPAGLVSDVRGYAAETHHGALHIERWKRVLIGLGVETYPGLGAMTAAEAQTYAGRGWTRWDPVVAELGKAEAELEAASQQQQDDPPPPTTTTAPPPPPTTTTAPPPPPPYPELTISGGAAVTEGADATFTISASPAAASTLTVNLSVSQSGDFASSLPATVTLSGGSATLRIGTIDDTADEPDGAITVALAGGSGYTLGAPSRATVAVADDDDPAPPPPPAEAGSLDCDNSDLTVDEITVAEAEYGFAFAEFTVTLCDQHWSTKYIDYRMEHITTDDDDLHLMNGTLIIDSFDNAGEIQVMIKSDRKTEGDETFALVIEGASAHRADIDVGAGRVQGTITDPH